MNYSRDKIEVNDCLLHETENSLSFDSEIDETKFCLSWENLSVRIMEKSSTFVEKVVRKFSKISETRDQQRLAEILKSASGYVEAGHMIAVMGPSGAGKTTLLDALAKRIQPTSGRIRVNGFEVSKKMFTKISSYVPQFDSLPAMLTTREYIIFSCALRLDRNTSTRERKAIARDVIINLGLEKCGDLFTNALSGGEKKILSLAMEIVTRPRILFLDEPTTGLDTVSALRVVESLKPVSATGIVLCSIHQPSMRIYNLFSRVIFLSHGETVFLGSPDDARLFFERSGFQCPVGFDESEYYVKVLSNKNFENFEYSNALPLLKVQNPFIPIYQVYTSSRIQEHQGSPGMLEINASEKGPSWNVQFNWLLWRHYLENRRTFVEGLIAFQYYAMSIFLVSIFFWGIDTHKQQGIQDVMGVLYMASSETIFSTAYSPLYEIQREISLYQREISMYGPSAYYIATAISWIPKAVIKGLLLSTMLFSLLGTRNTFFPTFLQFFACTIASGICGSAYGSMMASLIDDNEMATAIMVPLDLVAMLMAGVYYSLRTVKWYTAIFKYISIFYYTNEALAIAYWSQIVDIECESDKKMQCISSGSQVLLKYGYEESNFWPNILAMGGLTILMNLIGYLGTRRRRHYTKSTP